MPYQQAIVMSAHIKLIKFHKNSIYTRAHDGMFAACISCVYISIYLESGQNIFYGNFSRFFGGSKKHGSNHGARYFVISLTGDAWESLVRRFCLHAHFSANRDMETNDDETKVSHNL